MLQYQRNREVWVRKMIGYYNYTVILTYMSLLSALFGTHLAFHMNIKGALICLCCCGAFDSFDGMVARSKKDRTEEEKKFGIQIDSLVDMFAFGIFPSIIGYAMGLNTTLWFIVFALYSIGAVTRLGYFNVMEEVRQQLTTEKRKYYQGLPVTASSMIFPAVYLLNYVFPPLLTTSIYGWVMLIVAILFVLDIKVIKPDFKQIMMMGVFMFVVFIGLLLL